MVDVETEAQLIAAACKACPALTIDAIRWEVPMITIGYLIAAAAQMNGAKGVRRKPRGEKCLDRLHQLMIDRLTETGQWQQN